MVRHLKRWRPGGIQKKLACEWLAVAGYGVGVKKSSGANERSLIT